MGSVATRPSKVDRQVDEVLACAALSLRAIKQSVKRTEYSGDDWWVRARAVPIKISGYARRHLRSP